MNRRAVFLLFVLIFSSMAGCTGDSELEKTIEEDNQEKLEKIKPN